MPPIAAGLWPQRPDWANIHDRHLPEANMHRICSLLIGTIAIAGIARAGDQPAAAAAAVDPYLWLEDIHADRSMDWVNAHNAVTAKRFMESADFKRTRDRILEVLDSDARIPYVNRLGDRLYNFWKDKANPRGVWRSTTLEEYRKADPKWDVLIDIDALNQTENARWVFKGVDCLKPKYERCLVSLSPGGGDAVEVREFDIPTKSFVKDGFRIPVAKTQAGWIDENSLYVATDFGPGSMTDSGYPRIVKEWQRGTPLSAAHVVYEGKTTDREISANRDHTPGFERDIVSVQKDYLHTEMYQRKDGKLLRVEVPTDSDTEMERDWMLVRTRSPWTIGGTTYPTGTLVATKFDDFMAGKHDSVVLFKPDAHTALLGWNWTRHAVILDELRDVQSRLVVLTPQAGGWNTEPMQSAPSLSTIKVVDTDPDNSDEYWLDTDGFISPPVLQRGVLGESKLETVKQQPAYFDVSRFQVSQHFAVSTDGTRVPYFEVDPKGMKLDGSNPTLEYGYGGSGASVQPIYNGSMGRSWLERGGVYVAANIRGGGEYGPDWHNAALQANRHRSFEDFAAIAQDLIKRGVTSPKHLGAKGASNGGLLVGNMLTQYPQLFGAIFCEVPLLDMKRYSHLSAGASWMAEYGNPDTSNWDFIRTFSPYQNVKADAHYPPVLFYTATSDDRVGPVQARKMAAKMEGLGLKNVWFYENLEGGHGSGADNWQSATKQAVAYTFLWDQLR
jgi:prolyl oligopeptidase